MGEVISLFDRPAQWKQIFQSFSEDVTVNVYLNLVTCSCHVVMITDEGESMSVNLDVQDTAALAKHLITNVDKYSVGK